MTHPDYDIRLLVYGSLFNRESASAGVGRPLNTADYKDCEVRGYRLAFDLLEDVEVEGSPARVCFLNIAPDSKASFPAKIIRISESELTRLHTREKNYNLIDISAQIDAPGTCTDAPVVTFVGKPAHRLTPAEQPAVLERYIAKVSDGLAGFESAFVENYLACLKRATEHARLVHGAYRFVSSAQNSMTNC